MLIHSLASGVHARRRPHGLLTSCALLALATVAGCASPGSGPTTGSLERSAATAPQGNFPIVELTGAALSATASDASLGLAALSSRRFDGSVLRPGDTIDVKIFDTGEQGLISSADSKMLPLGSFRIDQRGQVNLPYVGRVRAAGSSASSLQDRIAGSLKGSSVSPQASVFVTEAGGSGFTVSGAVNGAGRFNLTSQGERVLDAVAMAGGPASPAGETEVSVIRGSQRASVAMDRLLAEPAQNIYVQPNDQIFLRQQASSFTSFGAFKTPGEFKFQPGELNMAQAVARSGGLLDDRANPQKVYLFRYEPAETAQRLGVIPANGPTTGFVPVVYLVDMTKTPSFFQMQSFMMKKGDTLYVPNTGSAEFGKAFQIFQKSPPTAAAPLPD